MGDESDSGSGDESGAWDVKARVRRHELIIAKLQTQDAVTANELKNLTERVSEVRTWLIAIVVFVCGNLILGLGSLILSLLQSKGP